MAVLILSVRLASKRNLLRNVSVIRMISRIWSPSKDITRNAFRLTRYVGDVSTVFVLDGVMVGSQSSCV
jgi:hypothetical protein